jgi:hypothetical protein
MSDRSRCLLLMAGIAALVFLALIILAPIPPEELYRGAR